MGRDRKRRDELGAGLRKKVFGEALDWGGASLELARNQRQWKLTIICNSSARNPMLPLCTPGLNIVHSYIFRKNTHKILCKKVI